jgi:hypothetical protein
MRLTVEQVDRRSGEARRLVKAHARQEVAHLDLRVHPRLDEAVELEDQRLP